MANLKERSFEAEIMDDFSLGGDLMDKTLKELEVINKLLGGDYVTIKGIERIVRKKNLENKTLSIADLGCGGGDMLVKIARWARKKDIKVRLVGVDANDYIVNYARKNTEAYEEIEYLTDNIFSEKFKSHTFDIVISTLFTHHFNDKELTALYAQLKKQTRYAILTNDIHRHWLAYHSINMLTRLFSKSEMVKNDAGVSVKRSFKSRELKKILHQAGHANFNIRWMWAFRWQVLIWC